MRTDRSAGHSHSLVLRLDTPPEPETLAAAADDAAWRYPALAGCRAPWIDGVPGPADGPVAARRLAAERHRSLGAFDGPLRVVLLRYADGRADLVLVAHRVQLGRTALRAAADALLGGEPQRSGSTLWRKAPDGVEARAAAVPDWALGTDAPGAPAVVELEPTRLPELPDAELRDTLLAATALVLHRYGGEGPQVVATGAETRAGQLFRAVALEIDETAPAAALLAAAREVNGTGDGTSDQAAVALLVGEHPGGDYLPCLAPPFPLTIAVDRHADGHLDVRCHLRTGAADPEIVRGFLRHVCRAAGQLIDGVDLIGIELLDAAERERVIALGQPEHAVTVPHARIEQALARWAAERPDAVALHHEGTEVTYRELAERSDRVAAGLRAAGVEPGSFVGVCLDRSAELIIAMLGVLKAGAAYVPIDPTHPTDRIAYLVEDAGMTVLIGSADRPGAVPVETLLTSDGPAPDPAGTPDDAAYVIYTSGSTGRPKGVVVPHRNVLALLAATTADFGLGADDTWTLFHSAAFDFSVWEIWGCLLTGGRLVVVPYFAARAPQEFRALLARERVTVLNQTPSAFTQLLDVADRDPLAVRLVVFGGEPLDVRGLCDWFDQRPESVCRVVNMFGITETTVHVTAQTLTRGDALAGTRSVGRALPGWSITVRDPRGRLVPPGVAGEIHVGGAGVAEKYLGRPELTAERFVPDGTGRRYRSGDLGRLRPDGRLDHLGRIDHQVKLRGYRIETGEIRSVLLDDPAVRAVAVVLANAEDAAEARLDAYVVLHRDGDSAAVRRHATRLLPDYMVPATVTPVPALPLTANGKLDVAALPGPGIDRPAEITRAPIEMPAGIGNVEDVLVAIWSRVLGVAASTEDDFFDLGGNSLLAIRLCTALREHGLPEVSLRELYVHRTVRGVAAAIGGTQEPAGARA